jgi:hypothetical protein
MGGHTVDVGRVSFGKKRNFHLITIQHDNKIYRICQHDMLYCIL